VNDKNDGGLILGIGAAVITCVIALVIGLAVMQSTAPPPTESSTPEAVQSSKTDGVLEPVGAPLAVLHFAPASARLPHDLATPLQKVLNAAREKPDAQVLISAFLDAENRAEHAALLAKERTIAVRMVLVGAGIAQDRIHLQKPTHVTGSKARQTRRVEVRVQ